MPPKKINKIRVCVCMLFWLPLANKLLGECIHASSSNVNKVVSALLPTSRKNFPSHLCRRFLDFLSPKPRKKENDSIVLMFLIQNHFPSYSILFDFCLLGDKKMFWIVPSLGDFKRLRTRLWFNMWNSISQTENVVEAPPAKKRSPIGSSSCSRRLNDARKIREFFTTRLRLFD